VIDAVDQLIADHHPKQIASSAGILFVRRTVVSVLSAISTAVIARTLGSAMFGSFSAALAVYYLFMSAGDLGFSLVLGRELAVAPADRGAFTRAATHVMTAWAVILTGVMFGIAASSGLTSDRGVVLLWMLPAVASTGLGGARQVFLVTYQTKRLAQVDTITNILSAVLICSVAIAHLGIGWIAAATCCSFVINSIWIAVIGFRLIDTTRATSSHRRRVIRQSLPLGIASLLSSAYFTIDMVVIGFIVSGRDLGYYAAAVKFLSILVTVPGLVLSAALPGLSIRAEDRVRLGEMMATVWHWLVTIGLPLCAAVGVFAPAAIHLFFGRGYDPSINLLRVLAGAAVVTLVSNIFGTVLVSLHRSRWMVIQNVLALVLNVAGNVVLVPRYGIAASAWLTLATELFVCVGAAIALRRSTSFAASASVSVRPALAVVTMAVVGLTLNRWSVAAIPVAGIAFVAVLSATGGWPSEMHHRLPPVLVRSGSA
jgi:O-antigen/teichoic acid export membrane protein